MPEKKRAIHTGHRGRVKEEFLTRGLAGWPDHRVLELILFYAIPQGDVNPLAHELIDRFGDIPRKVQQLLQIALLKSLAHSAYVTSVEDKRGELKLTMYERAKVQANQISGLIAAWKGELLFKAENPPYFIYCRRNMGRKEKDSDVLELVKKLLNDIKGLLE